MRDIDRILADALEDLVAAATCPTDEFEADGRLVHAVASGQVVAELRSSQEARAVARNAALPRIAQRTQDIVDLVGAVRALQADRAAAQATSASEAP